MPKDPLAVPCDACRMPIRKVMGPNGRVIPVQRVNPVYRIQNDERGNPVLVKEPLQGDRWVSHFQTCPAASRFSSRGRRG